MEEMEWIVSDNLGAPMAFFRYGVDALEYKRNTEEGQEFLTITRIGGSNG